jgi:methyl-accepting chemotaxis protein
MADRENAMSRHLAWSIKARIVCVGLVAVLGALVLTAFNLYAAQQSGAAMSSLYRQNVLTLVEVQKLDSKLRDLRFRVAGVLLDAMPVQGSLNHIRQTRPEIEQTWAVLGEASAAGVDAEQRALLQALSAGRPEVDRVLAKVQQAYEKGDKGALTDVLEQDWAQLHKAFVRPLESLIPLKEAQARATHDAAVAAGERLKWLSLGLALLVAVTTAIVAWLLARAVSSPLSTLAAAVQRIAAGDLSRKVVRHANDEIGHLATHVDAMQASLLQLVSVVRGNAESVATASEQIAHGNQDLSQRTERQASALQQTAATMDELGSTVRNNADNARQANQLAHSASDVAVRGGEVVGQVVETMKGINDSSRKIADIIGVIDGIAFQTNILALNAAVEAARAGEQGRGFAVVAGEVRTLAQRSAEAAREIKALIGTSVERVERGTALVDQAGRTMQEVVQSIRRVTDIVGEISAASGEQASGVAQVGQAVSEMDQATQQNAALVEQSAAAAESLKQQAQHLVAAVGAFKIAHDALAVAVPATHAIAKPPIASPLGRSAARGARVVANEDRPVPAQGSAQPRTARQQTPVAANAGDDWETF